MVFTTIFCRFPLDTLLNQSDEERVNSISVDSVEINDRHFYLQKNKELCKYITFLFAQNASMSKGRCTSVK